MGTVTLNWNVDGDIDQQWIYRDTASFDTDSLPEILATVAAGTTSYADQTVNEGETYYYRVASVNGTRSKLSDELRIDATNNDPYFSLVDSLIFADASSFPSTAIVDSSANARSITVEGDAKIVSPSLATPKFSDGTIAFDGSYDRISLPCTALGTSDFTAEMWLKSINGGVDNGRLFAIGSQDTQGGLLFCKFPTSATAGFNLILRDNGSFPAPIQTDRIVITGEMQHSCLMRKEGVFYVFVDGVLVGYTSDYTLFSLTGTILYLGSGSYIGDGTASYWDSWRLTRHARYDVAGFIPPVSKFIAV
ncbi:LamG-like jellyroll fold domain-containing protein [Acinetobacter sp. ANC 3791]|uniref:LamG-like jellyroll fold domain-containing protein n=1 Tax=Acinetobacter sp. ANC 3791 TaxID=2529836 RepID=UPI00103F7594|nr:LamG-like jellyroll fold domain-containing protein [Acinetobacter sp. ANC 3791]TCB86273.1 hypothetical protein E0H90_00115 [Acinetobacter sp. ANC 3791]